MSCGNAGDVRGDPRRGFCMVRRHAVGSMGTCDAFTTVSWEDRLPTVVQPKE